MKTAFLPAGASVGSYRIERFLDEGGMGQVYQALDTRLLRRVALKILPPDVAGAPHRLRRFEQEARAASALNHPNLAVIYDVGEATRDGQPLRYLAMELVEGGSLAALLQGPRLSLARCLGIASRLAEGLAAAHEAGIIHRDVKPSNVLITRHGQLKLIDFGLAKLRRAEAEGPHRDETDTSPGVVMGTVGYMAPEQARGEPATAASDQFAFGCILYEMLTTRRAFQGSSTAETLSAILRDEPPPLREIVPLAPWPLVWIVQRCLAKTAADRYASTRDLAREVQQVLAHLDELVPQQRPLPRLPPLRARPWAAAAVAASAAVAGWGVLWLWPTPASVPEFRPLTFRQGLVGGALFVPRSEAILYTAAWDGMPQRTYQALLDSPGLDRSLDAGEQFPLAYSSDGSQVLVLQHVFRWSTQPRGTLAWWPAQGGQARPVLEDAGWADWADRGRFFVVVRNTGGERLLDVFDANGVRQRTLFRTAGGISSVHVSPDERHVAFVQHPDPYRNGGAVWLVASDGSSPRAVTSEFDLIAGLDWNRRSGELWFSGAPRSAWGTATIWKVGLRGPPRPIHVLPNLHILASVAPSGDRCLLIDPDSTAHLVVRRPGHPLQDLTWFGWSVVTDVSPDLRHVLFVDSGATQGTEGTWMRPVDGGEAVRLADRGPGRFSPDGRLIVTPTSKPGQPPQLELVPVGPGERRELSSSPMAAHAAPSFAGPTTLLFERSLGGAAEVWRMDTDGSGARSLGATGCEMPEASPSLDWFACLGEGGRAIFVYPMETGQGRRLHLRPTGGRFFHIRWNRSGDRIYAVASDRHFLTLNANSGAVLSEDTLPINGETPYDRLVGAAVDADAQVQAYSVERPRSGLLLMTVS